MLKYIAKLTYKRYGPFGLSLLAFIIATLSCFSLGILVLFALFTQPFQHQLHYSQTMINTIIIAQTVGISGSMPFFGYMADSRGTWILSTIAFFGYGVGFTTGRLTYENDWDYKYMVFSFFLIGISHGAFLFSCLLTSAKSFAKYYKTLAISLPNVIIGVSSVLEVLFIQNVLFNGDTQPRDDTKDFAIVFKFFAYFLCSTSALSLIASRLTDYIDVLERDIDHIDTEPFNYEASPLLTGAVMAYANSPSLFGSPMSYHSFADESNLIDDELELSIIQSVETRNQPFTTRARKFFRDPLLFPLILSFTCCIGSVELFLANMGSILDSLQLPDKVAELISLHSVASTIMRIGIMLGTDYISNTEHLPSSTSVSSSRFRILPISRLTIISALIILCGIGHLYLSTSNKAYKHVAIVIVLNGCLNAALFTLFPAILAFIWGIELLGTTWGTFSATQVLASLIYSPFYAHDYENHCVAEKDLSGTIICSTNTFFLTGITLLVSATAILFLQRKYIEKAKEFF